MGRWLPRRGWLGHDGLSGDLNGLTRPTVPSAAIQERMLARLRSVPVSSAGTASGLRGPVRPVRLGSIPHECEK